MISHSKPYITSGLSNKIAKLLKNGDFISEVLSDRVKKSFQRHFNLNNVYFTQSGTHAIFWILKGLHLKKDDEIIIPSYACPSILNAVISAGVTPVLCDVGEKWHMTRETVEQKINKKTKIIITVNLFGMFIKCSDFRFPGAIIINDLCQCPNIIHKDDQDLGDFMVFSFHPTKYLNAGGHGSFSISYDGNFTNYIGENFLHSNISNLNLIILEEQLEFLDEIKDKRTRIANIYLEKLSDEYTYIIEKTNNTFYRFPLTQGKWNFNHLQIAFLERNIAVRRGVDQLMHRVLNQPDQLYPNAVSAFNKTVSIPIYPSLKDEEITLIVNATNELLND